MTWFVPLACALSAAAPAAERQARVGPLVAVPSKDPFLTWTCSGTVDLAASGTVQLPRIESDPSQKDGPWSLERLKEGLPCAFARSRDGKKSLALVKTGESSYYVLFFEGERAAKAQAIHGPWALSIATGPAFPPRLEQRPEGDAAFLYVHDAKLGGYRQEKYQYPAGYE